MKEIIIIGGGLAGLIASIRLASEGLISTVIEKKKYPFHRVCGEYISNETVSFLKTLRLFPEKFNPPNISQLQLTSVNGKEAILDLDLGGFGVSRFSFDQFLYEKAMGLGVTFLLEEEATKVSFEQDNFSVTTSKRTLKAELVMGCYGKRSKLDIVLNRSFIKKRSPYIGVKYHIRTDHPSNRISLHNFKDGYCGVSNVEDGKTNLCYLSHRDNVKKFGNLPDLERAILYKNPYLKHIFNNSEFIFDRPETINEISFETKLPVENHILMLGDAAGMITPLCGNGMALAIHSAKIASELVIKHLKQGNFDRNLLETEYCAKWRSLFKSRLWAGRQIQRLFGNEWSSDLAVNLARSSKPVASFLVAQTHGNPF
jgi:flavin-dependent dehydrogenase